MRNLKFLVGLSLIMALFISCDNEAADLPEEVNSETRSLVGTASPEKIDLANEIHKNNLDTRVPFEYVGQLCPGELASGEVSIGSVFNPSEGDFWLFSADAGDVLTFQVNRTDCNSDPRLDAWLGQGSETDDLFYLGFLDDEADPACVPDCFAYGDPYLDGFVVPFSGYWTIAITEWGFASCVEGPMTYDIIISGQNTCTINIDGCDSGLFNQLS